MYVSQIIRFRFLYTTTNSRTSTDIAPTRLLRSLLLPPPQQLFSSFSFHPPLESLSYRHHAPGQAQKDRHQCQSYIVSGVARHRTDRHLSLVDADGGGAEALPHVWKTTDPQERSHQNAEGAFVIPSYSMKSIVLTDISAHWP
jgi:hypothetical protein